MREQIQIANVRLSVENLNGLWPHENFKTFESYEGMLSFDDSWEMKCIIGEIPKKDSDKILFDSKGSWKAFHGKCENEFWIEQYSNVLGKVELQSIIHVNNREKIAKLYFESDRGFCFPLDELFFQNALSMNRSCLIHSCSIEDNGNGYVFCGVSGAGKSTLSGIFDEANAGLVLSDERNALTVTDDQIFVSSTPWMGTGSFCFPKTVPLKAITILDPSHQGLSLTQMSIEQTIEQVFQTIFFPQFTKSGVERVSEVLSEVIQRVPCFKLSYDKEKSDVVSFLREQLFSQG